MTSQPLLSQLLRQAGTALCTISLVGCAVGPDFVKPDDRLAAVQLSPRADYTQAQETSAASFPSSWWTLFNDDVLADLQVRAQAGNLNLQMASERIEQSRAQVGMASSLLRSEEHTSELQSLMRTSYAVCCLKKKT